VSIKKGKTMVGVMALGQAVDLDRTIAVEAARLAVELKLAMADSLILATARTHDAILWTQDKHFQAIPGVRYFEKKEDPHPATP
jgi:predicted nucleic acid-binding protein